MERRWPVGWQPDAIEALLPFFDSESRVRIVVGDPEASIHGTVLAGYVYWGEDGFPTVIYDRSGRPDVHAWRLLQGPCLEIVELRPRRPSVRFYRHPGWIAPGPRESGRR